MLTSLLHFPVPTQARVNWWNISRQFYFRTDFSTTQSTSCEGLSTPMRHWNRLFPLRKCDNSQKHTRVGKPHPEVIQIHLKTEKKVSLDAGGGECTWGVEEDPDDLPGAEPSLSNTLGFLFSLESDRERLFSTVTNRRALLILMTVCKNKLCDRKMLTTQIPQETVGFLPNSGKPLHG